MSIRSKLSRTRRRSASSDETTQTVVTADSSSTSSSTDLNKSSASSASRLVKTFSWRGATSVRSATSGGSSSKKSRKSNRGTEVLHPSERPFTETNLRHQELLGHFTMTFGRRQSTVSVCSGISPCSSRQCSIDLGLRPTMAFAAA